MSPNLIQLDFEVYKYDWVAGFKISQTGEYVQIHNDRDKLLRFIDDNKNAVYFTINGYNYDENILDAILKNQDPYNMSQRLIVHKMDKLTWNLPIVTYDLQFSGRGKKEPNGPALKVFESNVGMSIEELPISATYSTKLSETQLDTLLKYNRHDLDATEEYMRQRFYESFMVKVHLINYFKLPFDRWIARTQQAILCEGLGAVKGEFPHQSFTLEDQFSNLQIANKEILDWLVNEDFYHKELEIDICGIPHVLAKGGIHGAKKEFYRSKNVWHVDFEAFYPTLMIEYYLLSRALSGKGRDNFIKLKADRLVAKKNKAIEDPALKIGINSVFGASDNEFLPLYDPSRSRLTCMYGQAYTIDLLEKLEPYINLIQSNTDGIIFELKVKDMYHEEIVRAVIAEFIERTGLNADIEKYDFVAQRDVNNYVGLFKGKEILIGNTSATNLTSKNAFYRGRYREFQSVVIERALAQYLLYKTPIEKTVVDEFLAGNWFRFQGTSKVGKQYHKVCLVDTDTSIEHDIARINLILKDPDVKALLKEAGIKRTTSYNTFYNKYVMDEYDDDQLELLNALDVKPVISNEKVTEVQHINRVFASKDTNSKLVLKKYKMVGGVEKGALIPNLPKNVFVFNKDLSEFTEEWQDKLDLEYYIEKAYEQTYAYITGDKTTKDLDIIIPIVNTYTLED